MTVQEKIRTPPFEKFMLGKPLSGHEIMLIAPHCDDEVLGCAGTLLRYLENGSRIVILFMTIDRNMKRKEEALKLWGHRKNVYLEFLQARDSALYAKKDSALEKMQTLLITRKPDVIFTPWILDIHDDHHLSSLYLASAIESSHFGQLNKETFIAQYEVNYPVYANHFVNISNYMTQKINMLGFYESQNPKQLRTMITHLNSYRAAQFRLRKVTFSEAYFVSRPEVFVELCNHLCVK